MNRRSKVNRDKLFPRTKLELLEFEAENGSIPDATLANILDAFLRWNGIIGFTGSILNIIEAAE